MTWSELAVAMVFLFVWAGCAVFVRQRRLKTWRAWTGRMGLKATGRSTVSYQFPPEVDGLQVSLQLQHIADGDRTCLTVSMASDDEALAPGPIATLDSSLSIHPRQRSARRGLECGDEAFSKDLVVRGDEVHCAALLDHATRVTLQRCQASHPFELEKGKISCTKRGILAEAEVKHAARSLLDVARRLRLSAASIPERLLGTARSDPEPRVRTRAIAAMIARYGLGPEVLDATGTTELSAVQQLLLDYLEADPHRQRVVFHALSKIATLDSIERLLRLKGDGEMSHWRDVCVDAIQKRLGTGDQGWLSLAAPSSDQGALSTADDGSTLAIAKSEKD